jgi:hypothetical protein
VRHTLITATSGFVLARIIPPTASLMGLLGIRTPVQSYYAQHEHNDAHHRTKISLRNAALEY